MRQFSYDKDKIINSLLYICHQLGGAWDKYSLLKILYFAERSHLAKYGRTITGDAIIAMRYGPVPSLSYDSLKSANIDNNIFEVNDDVVSCKKYPDMNFLSGSDIECINESIQDNKELNFAALLKKSHDDAYNFTIRRTGENSKVPFELIAKAGGANDELLKYISLNIENDSFVI